MKMTKISFKGLVISLKRYNKLFKRYKMEWKLNEQICRLNDLSFLSNI